MKETELVRNESFARHSQHKDSCGCQQRVLLDRQFSNFGRISAQGGKERLVNFAVFLCLCASMGEMAMLDTPEACTNEFFPNLCLGKACGRYTDERKVR